VHKKIAAAFTKKGREDTLLLSLPSSSGVGHYLVGVCIVENNIVIAHECPACIRKKACWHNDVALQAFLDKLWWRKELESYRVVYLTKKVTMSEDWVQIPIPGQPLEIEVDAYEQKQLLREYTA
jgi:hypothetical protein